MQQLQGTRSRAVITKNNVRVITIWRGLAKFQEVEEATFLFRPPSWGALKRAEGLPGPRSTCARFPPCAASTHVTAREGAFFGRTLVPRAGHRKLAVARRTSFLQKDGEYGRLIRAKHALNLLLCLCLLMLVLSVHCHSSFLSSIACVSLSLLPPTPLTTQRHHPITLFRRRRAPSHPWGR